MNQLAEMIVFARVVEARGFSAAARQLGMTTSAVSRSVARLETRMGGALLHRSTRSLTVTELGDGVYRGCVRIAQLEREIEAFAGHYASAPSGCLKLSAPVTYGQVVLAPLMGDFLALWPEVDVQLELGDQHGDIVADAVDVAIRIGGPLRSGLVARPLGRTRHVLVAAPRYLAGSPAPSRPEEIGRHLLVCAGPDQRIAFSRGSTSLSVDVVSRFRVNDDRALLGAVCSGLGIGIVPDFAARVAIERFNAVQILPDWALEPPHGEVPVHLVFSATRHMPRKIRAFIDFMVAKSEGASALQPWIKRVA